MRPVRAYITVIVAVSSPSWGGGGGNPSGLPAGRQQRLVSQEAKGWVRQPPSTVLKPHDAKMQGFGAAAFSDPGPAVTEGTKSCGAEARCLACGW